MTVEIAKHQLAVPIHAVAKSRLNQTINEIITAK